jgi:hypothetical protein
MTINGRCTSTSPDGGHDLTILNRSELAMHLLILDADGHAVVDLDRSSPQ